MKEFCSKAVQMRVSAHSGAEEEELLKATTSSLPKAQEHLATLFAGLNQPLIPPEYWGLTSTLQEKSSAHCTNTTQHIHSHGRTKMKEPHTWIPFLGKITGTLSIPSAVLLDADFTSKLQQIWQGWCQDVFWRELSPEHLVPFFGNPKSCYERSIWRNDTPPSFTCRIRLETLLFY